MAVRLLAAAGAGPLAPLGSYLNPPVLVGALALLLTILTAAETRLMRPADAVG